jgi:hypothetical protein
MFIAPEEFAVYRSAAQAISQLERCWLWNRMRYGAS